MDKIEEGQRILMRELLLVPSFAESVHILHNMIALELDLKDIVAALGQKIRETPNEQPKLNSDHENPTPENK